MLVSNERERRVAQRIRPQQTSVLEYLSLRSRVLDICLSGAFVVSRHPLPTGHRLSLQLRMKEQQSLAINAVVRRVEAWRGMGVQFVNMSEADCTRLRQFMSLAF